MPFATVRDELTFRGVKMLDIGYVTTIYMTLGFVLSHFIDLQLGPFDPTKNDQKTVLRVFVEVLLHFIGIGMLIYIIRNLVEQVPSPFHGVAGYNHHRLTELASAAVFITIFMTFQYNLRDKLLYLAERVGHPRTPHHVADV